MAPEPDEVLMVLATGLVALGVVGLVVALAINLF